MALIAIIAFTAVGVFGLSLSTFRWIVAARNVKAGGATAAPSDSSTATRFATVGQRGSLACAVAVLLIIAIGSPIVLVLHLTGPDEGPGKDVAAALAAALALVLLSVLIIPTVATQIAWTWRRCTPAAEAAVLASVIPGRRRMIIAARVTAVIDWTIPTAGAGVLAVILLNLTIEHTHAVATAYSRYDAATAVRSDLLERYVVGDVHCPYALVDPAHDSLLRCRVTSLTKTDTISATWQPDGYGNGTIHVVAPQHARLTRVSELPDRVPTAVSPTRLISDAEVTREVRSQMHTDGWDPSSRASRDLTCPGVSAGYGPGLIRCTIGKNPETQRWLDVYPVAGTTSSPAPQRSPTCLGEAHVLQRRGHRGANPNTLPVEMSSF